MEIIKRMSAVSKSMSPVKKEGFNKAQGYKFLSLESIVNELHQLMAENEVVCQTSILEILSAKEFPTKNGVGHHYLIKVETKFFAPDGSNLTYINIGEAIDYQDKGINKALTAAHKYALKHAFMIETSDDQDNDSNSFNRNQPQRQKPIPPSPQTSHVIPHNPQTMMEKLNFAVSYLQEKYGVTEDEIEMYLGLPIDEEAANDVVIARLRDLSRHLKNGGSVVTKEPF